MDERAKSIANEVSEELNQLFGSKLDRVILYGSYARGDFTLESDIDIMILLDCNQEEISRRRKDVSRVASRVGLRNDVMVSLLVRNTDEYEQQMEFQPFYQNIQREGVKLFGYL